MSHMQVQARNDLESGDGWGDSSAIVSHVTKDGVSSAPPNLVRLSRSDVCMTIGWQPPYTRNGIVVSYRVRA